MARRDKSSPAEDFIVVASKLPWWVSLLCAATLAWRAAITLRGKRMPRTIVLLPIAIAAMVGVQFSAQGFVFQPAGAPCIGQIQLSDTIDVTIG